MLNPPSFLNLNSTLGKSLYNCDDRFSTSNPFKERKMKLIVGIDVSKKKLDLSVYNGYQHKALFINNDKKDIEKMLRSFVSRFLRVMGTEINSKDHNFAKVTQNLADGALACETNAAFILLPV